MGWKAATFIRANGRRLLLTDSSKVGLVHAENDRGTHADLLSQGARVAAHAAPDLLTWTTFNVEAQARSLKSSLPRSVTSFPPLAGASSSPVAVFASRVLKRDLAPPVAKSLSTVAPTIAHMAVGSTRVDVTKVSHSTSRRRVTRSRPSRAHASPVPRDTWATEGCDERRRRRRAHDRRRGSALGSRADAGCTSTRSGISRGTRGPAQGPNARTS